MTTLYVIVNDYIYVKAARKMKNHPDQGDTTSSKDGQKTDLQETPRLGS